MLEAVLFPRSWPQILYFLTFVLHFLLDPDRAEMHYRSGPVLLRQNVAVRAVPVPAPVPQQWLLHTITSSSHAESLA